ncbi:DMT family transporter [Metasolibacillus meyeri]|uniref:DMT family transporter n=1 Tax=Metasolibacillus meyeri TaxID=1071052 RepID=A0AAW9NY36_9BACL|nr:DMT family transporter [Metasolibacillus meyeri]MEC1180526.1 DMT family transporter [Metasolibacillus meyeri]
MNKYNFFILIILTTFLMGSSFAVGKIGLNYSSPLLLAGLRFLLAGIIMAVIVKLLKRKQPSDLKNWGRVTIIGTLQTAGVMGCIFISLRTIPASESSILTFMNPLLVIIFGTLFLGIKYKWYQWSGVALGFLGVGITLGGINDFKIGIVFGAFSAVFWAVSTLLVNKWGMNFDTWSLSAYQMLFGGTLLLLLSLVLENPYFIVNTNSIFILLWLSIMSSIVQFAVWYFLLQNGEPGKTSSYLFLAPLFGVLTGSILLDEPISYSLIVGGVFILTGIYLVNSNFKNSLVKSRI